MTDQRFSFRSAWGMTVLVAVVAALVGLNVTTCNGSRAASRRARELLRVEAETSAARGRRLAAHDSVMRVLQRERDSLKAVRAVTRPAAARAVTVIERLPAGAIPAERADSLRRAVGLVLTDYTACQAELTTCDEQHRRDSTALVDARAGLRRHERAADSLRRELDRIHPPSPLTQLWEAKEEAAVLVGGGLLIYFVVKALR